MLALPNSRVHLGAQVGQSAVVAQSRQGTLELLVGAFQLALGEQGQDRLDLAGHGLAPFLLPAQVGQA